MNWFMDLFGFVESAAAVRTHLSVEGEWMRSSVNGARYRSGTLTTPNLKSLKERTDPLLSQSSRKDRTTLREVVADVQTLHKDPNHRGAIFQVASQCNLLEMVGPSVTPESGVTGYYYDRTQGPACAIACGAGTVYRNYFVPLAEQVGQTATLQVDTMKNLELALGGNLWSMRNGYLLPTVATLQDMTERLQATPEQWMEYIQIGVHNNVQVTLSSDPDQIVHQLYCSAMPVSYSGIPSHTWEPLGRLVLNAAYELSVRVAVEHAQLTGSKTLFLTLLGGGAFGNPTVWITDAILRALQIVEFSGLDVVVVSYGRSQPAVKELVRTWSALGSS